MKRATDRTQALGMSFLILGWLVSAGTCLGTTTKDKHKCEAINGAYSLCTDIGQQVCDALRGQSGQCGGECYICGGPGSLPARTCFPNETESCTYNDLNCGAQAHGNCQNQNNSCVCDGITADGDDCNIPNC